MTTPYFDDLSDRLRDSGLPEDEIAGTINDLTAYVTDSGADPEEEFGTPEEFAVRLVPSVDEAVPEPSAETWLWTADAFQDRRMLNRFGDEGWEVERVDAVGRFVSHRDAEHPQRWEYRRESVLPRRRQAVVDRLAPDGWEPCGTWVYFEYFKRPKAASLGPEAELRTPPDAPAKRFFWSRRFYIFVAGYAAFIAAVCTAWVVFASGDAATGFLIGSLVGAFITALISARLRHKHR